MFDDVLCFSHLRWSFVYQRPNHLMSRCAKRHRVYYIEEPHFDSDAPRLDVKWIENGLHVAVPHLPPGTSHEAAERMQRVLLDALVERSKIERPLAWLYTPAAVPTLRPLAVAGCVYDCMDELSLFKGAPEHLVTREEELFRIADVVFTGGQSLFEAKRSRHPNVFAFPSSVDFAHFEKARTPQPDPDDQARVPRPRIGFFGVIDERLDIELVDELAKLRPHYHFVMIGPVVKIDPATLPRHPNIHWIGPKQYDELPSYISGWDVAFMPFARNDATKFISPTKTLEYLAAGKPVVATSIRDVVQPYGTQNLVAIADDASAFAAAIDTALREAGTAGDSARERARDSMLAQTSWDRTWARMSALVHRAVAKRGRAVDEEEAAPCSTI